MRILTLILSLVCISAFAEITPEEINRLKLNAEKGDSAAQTFLGYCYNFGKGVQKDNVEAIKWYRKSAEQGNSLAQFFLGAYYHDAKGASKNDVEAVKWFRKSAEQGYARAQFWLGMYYLDNGVEGVFKENPLEAVMWLRKSAEQGEAMAQFVLGTCYHLGKGVQKDNVEAIKWYRKSAEQGNVCALTILAGLYYEGEGLNKDPVEAYAYYNLVGLVAVSEAQPAEVEAKSLAERHRKELEGELTPSQIEAGQKRSKELLALILVQREAKEESKAVIQPGKSSKAVTYPGEASNAVIRPGKASNADMKWGFSGWEITLLILFCIVIGFFIYKKVKEEKLIKHDKKKEEKLIQQVKKEEGIKELKLHERVGEFIIVFPLCLLGAWFLTEILKLTGVKDDSAIIRHIMIMIKVLFTHHT